MKKNIFVIGSQGYNKNYGGWETFVKNFANIYDKKKANIYVSEISFDKEVKEYKKNNINCLPVFTKKMGSATMMLYSIKSLYYVKKYIKKNNINNAIIYILGLKLGPFLHFEKKYFTKHGIKIYVNPDGLEWKRSKWSKPIKKYFLYAERTMLKHCDGIVCDSMGIKTYLEEAYPNNKVDKTFIAYGTKKINLDDVNEKDILKEYDLKKNNYCLVVGRCVPENNFELMIKEFMKSKIDKELVIISNIEGCPYYDELKEITNCDKDKRIRILKGIYDEIKLSTIRKNAFLYLHGHSVGGTNPSLLEALSLTNLNVLYDVNFNHQVGLDSCLYFNDKNNNLKKLLDDEEHLKSIQKKYGTLAKQRIEEEYTWKHIMDKYEKLFGDDKNV
ncbi:MAG TPA: DUF1972 domain-containing protein [Bacilli bacterium]|nr:DUF1972 domain-containing protein [Bacilli bacterium]